MGREAHGAGREREGSSEGPGALANPAARSPADLGLIRRAPQGGLATRHAAGPPPSLLPGQTPSAHEKKRNNKKNTFTLEALGEG